RVAAQPGALRARTPPRRRRERAGSDRERGRSVPARAAPHPRRGARAERARRVPRSPSRAVRISRPACLALRPNPDSPRDDVGVVVEALRKREFPVTQECVYLDHATFGPLPASHVRAATEMLSALANPDTSELGGSQLLDSVRSEAATMLHCDPGHATLLKRASEGLGLLAQGLEWRRGDEVIVHDRDFWGCLAPFAELARVGVRIRLIRDAGRGRFDIDDLEALVTPRTRAVCVSVVNRATGTRAPVEALGALCAERGI